MTPVEDVAKIVILIVIRAVRDAATARFVVNGRGRQCPDVSEAAFANELLCKESAKAG